VLQATSHASACALNRGQLGKGITIQAWGIVPKIREVDEFICGNAEARKVIRESHPEICFWALAGKKPMAHRKKSKAGFDERTDLLGQPLSSARLIVDTAMHSYRRKDVAKDDILDAIVLALVAFSPKLETFPSSPESDALGLTMEIVYAAPSAPTKE